MSDKPMRRWLQFHLSTAILATVIIGGLIGLNVRQVRGERLVAIQGMTKLQPRPMTQQGWPLVWSTSIEYTLQTSALFPNGQNTTTYVDETFSRVGIILDVLTGAFFILIVTVVCEFILRRREGSTK